MELNSVLCLSGAGLGDEVAAGKTYTDAYKSLSSRAQGPAKAGSALAKNREVQGRIHELTRRVTNKVVERTADRFVATRGGAETIYPEYRKKLKTMTIPPQQVFLNKFAREHEGTQAGKAPAK
jgi:hypothetical protein